MRKRKTNIESEQRGSEKGARNEKGKRPALKLMRGTRAASLVFTLLATFIGSNIAIYAANTYYNLDTGEVVVEQVQRVTGAIRATAGIMIGGAPDANPDSGVTLQVKTGNVLFDTTGTTQINGRVGIGGAADGAHRLKVTGTAEFTGEVTGIPATVGTSFVTLSQLQGGGGTGIDVGVMKLNGLQGELTITGESGVITVAPSGSNINLSLNAGGINAAKLADNAVTTAKILDGNVTDAKLATNAVTNVKILDGAVSADKLAADSVTTIKIADNAVTTTKIGNNQVTNAKLANPSITFTGADGIKINTAINGTSAINLGQTVTIGVDAATIAGSFFQQGGNEFGALATLGTTDANDLRFITGSSGPNERMRILSTGEIGIGNATPLYGLDVGVDMRIAGALYDGSATPSAGGAGQVLVSTGTGVEWLTPGTGPGGGGPVVGTVTSVDVAGGSTGLTFSGGPVTSSGTITMGGTLGVANGGTGATTAAGARTNLGATTVGSNLFTLTDPGAISFLRVNADNSVTALDASTFRTAIDAVQTTRTINTGDGLTGGGNLSADRTISLTGQSLALHNLATNGIIVRTGSGTVAGRTIVGSGAVTVTNGDGVAGNPTITVNTGTGGLADDFFKEGGNSFSKNAVLGTNDNFSLSFETNGVTRMTVAAGGAVSTTGALTSGGAFTASSTSSFGELATFNNGITLASANRNITASGGNLRLATSASSDRIEFQDEYNYISQGNLVISGNFTMSGLTITNAGGVVTLTPDTRLVIDGDTEVNGALLVGSADYDLSTDSVIREVIPIFKYEIPVQCDSNCSSTPVSISNALAFNVGGAAKTGSTREYRVTVKYSGGGSGDLTWDVYGASVTDSFNTTATANTSTEAVFTSGPLTMPGSGNWTLRVQKPSGGSAIQVSQVFLTVIDKY